MEPPSGYPPPTLVRRRSGGAAVRFAILLMALFAAVGFYIVSHWLNRPSPKSVEKPQVETAGAGSADAAPATLPDTEKQVEPPVIVERPVEKAMANAGDARKANQWYLVPTLGDGPGVIYSRDGGAWNFAFACTTRTRMIEFIAVGTGSPGGFDQQSMTIGKVKLMMDATYSKDGGGTISTSLPASHPFFKSLDGSAPVEVRLLANRKTILPIGADVVRLIRECRGRV